MTQPRDAALAAHDAGICVVPPRQDGSKAPEGFWRQYQTERPSREQIEAWYADEFRSGVGFVCGEVSDGLELFEFEGRAVEAGIVQQFVAVATERGLRPLIDRLVEGYLERSPTGGCHLLYRCSETGIDKLAKDAEGRDLIEVKGEGGYVIVAPTNGHVHPNGGSWELIGGGIATIATITPEERRQLHELARYFDERHIAQLDTDAPIDEARSSTAKAEGWMGKVVDEFNARTTWPDVLAGHFMHLFDRGRVGYWHHEGAENRISATTNATGTDRLIVFSGTAEGRGWRIYDGRNAPSYDRFSAYVFIETGSHDTTARVEVARRLRNQGYGPPPDDWSFLGDTTTETATPTPLPRRPPTLPDEFWTARPVLAHIRQAAHARRRSADAVLHVVLARVAAICPHTVVLPAIVGNECPLSYFAAIVAPSGVGKSTANAIGRHLVPAPAWVLDQLPLGSGEGLAEILFEWVEETNPETGKVEKQKRQTKHNAFIYADEGQILGEIGTRKSSTLLPTIRSAWTGDTLGQTNANRDRFRPVPAGTYAFGLIAGFQSTRAGDLLDDADGGTPQRFGWASAADPNHPDQRPDWPGPLDWTPPAVVTNGKPLDVAPEIVDEVDAADLARQRGESTVAPLDAHAYLFRLKVAGLLAVLDDRRNITLEDWRLAGLVADTSNAVRASVIDTVTYEAQRKERATSRRLARRAVDAERAKDHRRLLECAQRIKAKVEADPGEWTQGRLRSHLGGKWREVFSDGLDHALAEGWVTERSEPGQGDDKQRLYPGDRHV